MISDLERIAGWNLGGYGGAELSYWQQRHASAALAFEKFLAASSPTYLSSQLGQQQKSIMSAQLTAQAALLGQLAPKSAAYDLATLPPMSAPVYQKAFADVGLPQSTAPASSGAAPNPRVLLWGAAALAVFFLFRRS